MLPLKTPFVCGHNFGGDSFMGRETSLIVIERDGVEYISPIEYGSCSICNDREEKRIKRRINYLIRKNRSKGLRN